MNDKELALHINRLLQNEVNYINEQHKKELYKLENVIKMPDTSQLDGLSLFNVDALRRSCPTGCYGIGKKVTIKYKYYTVGVIANTLPMEMQHSTSVYIVAVFLPSDKLYAFYVLNEDYKPYLTFHTNGSGSICLGDMQNLTEKVSLKPSSIKEAINELVVMFETINPRSWMTYDWNGDMLKLYKYVFGVYTKNSERCRNCDRILEECGCFVCDRCEERVEGVCEADYCDDCCVTNCDLDEDGNHE